MIYNLLAPFYDKVNEDVNYSLWADFIEKIIERDYTEGKPSLALDLGCGTGSMTFELARRGYDMTGVDFSVEMLNIASDTAERLGFSDKILWLCQDMCEFELYGTVDVTVSCLDCINHLTDRKSLTKCFNLVHNYLIPNGLFIFDINGRHKFENIYADNTYAMEEDGSFCVWQNYYNKKSGICDFYITVFKEEADGKYTRHEDLQREKMYTVKAIKKALVECGFELLGAYSDFDFNPACDDDDMIYFVARCKKQ